MLLWEVKPLNPMVMEVRDIEVIVWTRSHSCRAIELSRCDRDAGHGVEEREGDATEEAQRGIRETEVETDRLGQDGQDLAVDEVEDVNNE